MIYVPRKVEENGLARFVASGDEAFDAQLARISAMIAESGTGPDEIKAIALAGPTCSGKTTAAKKLSAALAAHGKVVHTVSIDDYYIDRAELERRAGDGEVDLDSPDTIDIDALAVTISEIFDTSMEIVEIPQFDFNVGKRVKMQKLHVTDDDVFIFEGIQALYPNVSSLLMKYPSASIFICVSDDVKVGGQVFRANDVRLMRRIVRDYFCRSTGAEDTLRMWGGVRANEERNIFPNAARAGYRINSLMPYEIGMLKPYLEKILAEVPSTSEFRPAAEAILASVRQIAAIDTRFLADDSLYHEFV